RDVQGERFGVGAVVRRAVGRQEAGETERDPTFVGPHSLPEEAREEGETARTTASRGLQGAGLSLQVRSGARLDGQRVAASVAESPEPVVVKRESWARAPYAASRAAILSRDSNSAMGPSAASVSLLPSRRRATRRTAS